MRQFETTKGEITKYRFEFTYSDFQPKWKLKICKLFNIIPAKSYYTTMYFECNIPVKVGEYVRFDNGYSARIISLNKKEYACAFYETAYNLPAINIKQIESYLEVYTFGSIYDEK